MAQFHRDAAQPGLDILPRCKGVERCHRTQSTVLAVTPSRPLWCNLILCFAFVPDRSSKYTNMNINIKLYAQTQAGNHAPKLSNRSVQVKFANEAWSAPTMGVMC